MIKVRNTAMDMIRATLRANVEVYGLVVLNAAMKLYPSRTMVTQERINRNTNNLVNMLSVYFGCKSTNKI